jgi:hypothetical protein
LRIRRQMLGHLPIDEFAPKRRRVGHVELGMIDPAGRELQLQIIVFIPGGPIQAPMSSG